jgi:TDG/mug DNA glycosylase family protein
VSHLSKDPGHRVTEEWMDEQVTTLADLLRPGLRIVVVGINPTPVSVNSGHYWQGSRGQTLFRRLRQVGLLADGVGFEDDRAFAAGVGFTDVVKRPTRRADDVAPHEMTHGCVLLAEKLQRYRPEMLLFVFKGAATTLLGAFGGLGFVGLQFAGAEVYVMPRREEKRERAKLALDELTMRLAAT